MSWGGRPFQKSRFGQCLDPKAGVVKVASEPYKQRRKKDLECESRSVDREALQRQFTYTINPLPICSNVPSGSELPRTSEAVTIAQSRAGIVTKQPHCTSHANGTQDNWFLGSPKTIQNNPELYPLSPRLRTLLGYFQNEVSRSFACHEGIQRNICSTLIPMAFDSAHLMAAMQCAAASHRLSAGLDGLDDVLHLRCIAIQRLKIILSEPDSHDLITALATCLVLCMNDIVAPEAVNGDWRVHLFGASVLLERLKGRSSTSDASMRFMKQLYVSIKVIASGYGFSFGQYFEDSISDEDYIDDLAGFSTSLVPIFDSLSNGPPSSGTRVVSQNVRLIERVRAMLVIRRPRFRHEIDTTLSISDKTDFWLLDEAYHHMALLQLYERSGTPQAQIASVVQRSIERIISCIGSMNIEARPCPGVATLPPLFAAGCSTTNEHERAQILGLLLHVQECFGMGNVSCTYQFLESKWAADNEINALEKKSVTDLKCLPY